MGLHFYYNTLFYSPMDLVLGENVCIEQVLQMFNRMCIGVENS
jgi:hypothetical protein